MRSNLPKMSSSKIDYKSERDVILGFIYLRRRHFPYIWTQPYNTTLVCIDIFSAPGIVWSLIHNWAHQLVTYLIIQPWYIRMYFLVPHSCVGRYIYTNQFRFKSYQPVSKTEVTILNQCKIKEFLFKFWCSQALFEIEVYESHWANQSKQHSVSSIWNQTCFGL